ncbi:MAG: serine/threonine-protein kinase [Myxococcota bacterium]
MVELDSMFARTRAAPRDARRDARAKAVVKARLLGAAAPPVSIGRYEVQGVLGRGGMGIVYRARDPRLQRSVALKLVSARSGGAAERERLLREGRALARLVDPNIVTVLDAGVHDDDVYFAMELVRGQTLTRWLRTERTPDTIVDVFVQAARGLAAAHRAGIVHRDFKPDNVLVGDDGRVRVVDFGLARPVHADAPSTASTTSRGSGDATRPAGTPGYVAPEQRRGEPTAPASDQFSFFVALTEALTGGRPRAGDSPDLGGGLGRTVARGLSPDPANRWPNLDTVAQRLQRRTRPRRSRGLAVAGGLLLAVGFGAGGATLMTPDPPGDSALAIDRAPSASSLAGPIDEAWAQYDAGRFERAHALARALAARASDPSDQVRLHRLQAKIANDELRFVDAQAAAERARTLAAGAGDARAELDAVLSLAFALRGQHRLDEALRELRSAEALVVREGNGAVLRAEILRSESAVHNAEGRVDEAAPLLAEAIELRESAAPGTTARMYQLLGSMQSRLGQHDAALAAHDKALAQLRQLAGDEHPDVELVMISRAQTLRAMGRADEAAAAYEESVARLGRRHGWRDRRLAIPLLNLGIALRERGELAAAAQAHTRYREIVRDTFAPDDPEHGRAAITLAESRLAVKDWAGAAAAASSAAITARRHFGDTSTRTAYAYDLAGQALGQLGRVSESHEKCMRALTIAETALGADSPRLVHYLLVGAEAERSVGETEAADLLLARAVAIAETAVIRPDVRAHLRESVADTSAG